MMKKITMLTMAGMLAIPATAQAKDFLTFSGTATLGYGIGDVSGLGAASGDLDAWSLDVETDIGIGDAWNVGVDLGYADGNADFTPLGPNIGADGFEFSIEPSYHLPNGAYVGVYYGYADVNVSGIVLPFVGTGFDADAYGIFGGYEGQRLWVEGFAGRSDVSGAFPFSTAGDDYGVAASYQFGSRTEVFASLLNTNVTLGGATTNLTAISAGAEYDFTNSLSAYGALSNLRVDVAGFAPDVSAFGGVIGVAYDFNNTSLPITLNAEYSHTETDQNGLIGPPGIDPSVDRFSVGVTIALNGGSGRILNSNTNVARGEYRSVIEALGNLY